MPLKGAHDDGRMIKHPGLTISRAAIRPMKRRVDKDGHDDQTDRHRSSLLKQDGATTERERGSGVTPRLARKERTRP